MTALPTCVNSWPVADTVTIWSQPTIIFRVPSPPQIAAKMKIAVLTSGGDSAGMNAVVRGVVRAGIVKFASSFSILSMK
jgi:hypothetical protein